jgi:hypothetical protein
LFTRHAFRACCDGSAAACILNYAPAAPIVLNPELPAEFVGTVNKALEKDRELRCQSAAELRADLKRLQRKSSGGSSARPMGADASVNSHASAAGPGPSPSGAGSGSVLPPAAPPSGSGEYSDVKNFKKKAKAALDKVRGVYPALKISQANGGFMLHPGSTAVAPALN